MKKDQTVIKQKTFIFLTLATTASPLLWWLFILCSPVLSREKFDLFLFEDFEQKLYWYVFDTTEILCYVLFSYIIHRLNPYVNLLILTKWAYLYQIFRIGEYWMFRGKVPLLPFIVALILLAIDLYRRKNTH